MKKGIKTRIGEPDAERLREAVHMMARWFEAERNEQGQASFNDCLIESIELDLIAAFYPLRELCPHTAIDSQAGCCRKCGINVEDIPGQGGGRPVTDPADQTEDGVTFVPVRGVEAAFIGVHLVGAVRADPPAWRSFLSGELHAPWHKAADADAARAALRRQARDWYDALHTRLAPGQAERLTQIWIA
jgi:hypothetical protein